MYVDDILSYLHTHTDQPIAFRHVSEAYKLQKPQLIMIALSTTILKDTYTLKSLLKFSTPKYFGP